MSPKGADFLFGVANGSQKAALPSKNLEADLWEEASVSPNVRPLESQTSPAGEHGPGLPWAGVWTSHIAHVTVVHISSLPVFLSRFSGSVDLCKPRTFGELMVGPLVGRGMAECLPHY